MLAAVAIQQMAEALHLRQHLPGAILELGVAAGDVINQLARCAPQRQAILLDTFAGLPERSREDGESDQLARGRFCFSLATVANVVDSLERVVIVKGEFPQSVAGWQLPALVLVHVDADLYAPTRAAIAILWPLVVPGGIMFFDDVGNLVAPGVRQAIEEAGIALTYGPDLHPFIVKASNGI